MNRYLVWLLSLLWLNTYAVAADSLTLLKHIPRQVRFFTSDPLGNTYLVLNDQSVLRLNAQGDSIGFFNQIQKGVLTHIDATNPLRVLLFYGQYGYVVILDNQTTLKSSFSLPRLGIFNAPAIANSADAQIWTYDPGTGELIKVDDSPQVRFKVGLRNVLDVPLNPCIMVEQDRRFFLFDSTKGVFVFDQYGLFKVRYPITTKAIQFFNDYLVYYNAPNLISYNIRSYNEQIQSLPNPESIRQVRIERNTLYVLRSNGLSIYSWPAETK
jgi:hypothetical protein